MLYTKRRTANVFMPSHPDSFSDRYISRQSGCQRKCHYKSEMPLKQLGQKSPDQKVKSSRFHLCPRFFRKRVRRLESTSQLAHGSNPVKSKKDFFHTQYAPQDQQQCHISCMTPNALPLSFPQRHTTNYEAADLTARCSS